MRASEASVIPREQMLTDIGRYDQSLIDAGVLLVGEGGLPR